MEHQSEPLRTTAAQTERLMRTVASQTLTELNDLYNARYAALQNAQND